MNNVTWVPVAKSTIIRWSGADGDGESEQLALQVCITRNGQDIGVLAMHPPKFGDELFHPSGELPPEYALCRAVAVQWSQEPPQEPGGWWEWHLSRMRLKPILRHLLLHSGDLAYYEPRPGGRIDVVRIADLPDDTWWCFADIPICPAALEFLRSVGITPTVPPPPEVQS